MYKPRLLAPGPVEVPPQVLEASARPMIHHRTDAFKQLFVEVREKLAQVAQVPGEDVLILAGSGTAGFEAGLLACVPRGDKVLGINAGKFGERWVKLARHYGYEVVEMGLEWGQVTQPEAVRDLLKEHPDTAAVMTTHSETSTGALHDIEAISQIIQEMTPDALFLVDCVTSLGVAELRPKEWNLDGIFSGSQKGLMTSPGLAFAWLSERAWAREGDTPTFYLDLRKERKSQQQGQTAYTPAVSLVAGLNVALDMLLEEGMESVWARRERMNRAILEAGEVLGCRAYAERISPAGSGAACTGRYRSAPDCQRICEKRGAHRRRTRPRQARALSPLGDGLRRPLRRGDSSGGFGGCAKGVGARGQIW